MGNANRRTFTWFLTPRAARGVTVVALIFAAALTAGRTLAAEFEASRASVEGSVDERKARLVIEANLGALASPAERPLHAVSSVHRLRVLRDRLAHEFLVTVEAIQGGAREVILPLAGEGEIRDVSGDHLESWSVRRDAAGGRALVLRIAPDAEDRPRDQFSGIVTAETPVSELPAELRALSLSGEKSALTQGYVVIEASAEAQATLDGAGGLAPIDLKYLPPEASATESADARVEAFRFQGSAYSLPLRVSVARPELDEVALENVRLAGTLRDGVASFVLMARANAPRPENRLVLLSGDAALSAPPESADWTLSYEDGTYIAMFSGPGSREIAARFHAGVRSTNGWQEADFRIATGPLAQLTLEGLPEGVELEVVDAARPERIDGALVTTLPANGRVRLRWREAREEETGRLFHSVDATFQAVISPGLLRQVAALDVKVMQGELARLSLLWEGGGEITRVLGPAVLAWNIEPMEGAPNRRLVIQFNEPQRDATTLEVHWQRPLGAFPETVELGRLVPQEATRFGGRWRVLKDGAVRLETVLATGLSQISPEQFEDSEETRQGLPDSAAPVFAYRFAGPEHALRVQADNVLPELSASQTTVYQFGDAETAIDLDMEVEIREAPLRELRLRAPAGYALARLDAPGLNDYFLTEAGSGPGSLRLVYASPVTGRQVVRARFERARGAGEERWALPRVELENARSSRGQVGLVVEQGFRTTQLSANGLAEVAPAFFPKKVAGLQAAYRIVEDDWSLDIALERVAQTAQADAFHLFSVGEGIAYGSSLIQYLVSGSPVNSLRLQLSDEYFNVEFTGKNIRNWQRVENGYEVQLHAPVSGPYTLLATYERPFSARGEMLSFTGARPLDAQSEQGHTVVISAYQFQVRPAEVSANLMEIEPVEIPPEYRLLFDAPVLAAYRYTSRPFNLRLALDPLRQGEVVSQVIDRAALLTRISEEGQVVTEARYFVKNKGGSHLRLTLPEGASLWSVTADGARVAPIMDGAQCLIPLPPRSDPDVVTELVVTVASEARGQRRLALGAPSPHAPVLLAEWQLTPGAGRRLAYRGGAAPPVEGGVPFTGFAWLARALPGGLWILAIAGFVSLAIAAWAWSGAARGQQRRLGIRRVSAGALGFAAAAVAIAIGVQFWRLAPLPPPPGDGGLRFVAPIQEAGAAWTVQVANLEAGERATSVWPSALLLAAAAFTWVCAWVVVDGRMSRRAVQALGWVLVFWAALRLEGGGGPFMLALLAFALFAVLGPAWLIWRRSAPEPRPGDATGPATAPAVGLALALAWFSQSDAKAADAAPWPESVKHEIVVDHDHAIGLAHVRWLAKKGDLLPVLFEPGILTDSDVPGKAARWVQITRDGRRVQALLAEADGVVEFELKYHVGVETRPGERGFRIPTHPGLAHSARVLLRGTDAQFHAPDAVSIEEESAGEGTAARLVFRPGFDAWVGWSPRSRNTRLEDAVFFAEWTQVYAPGAGGIEGRHELQIRPAKGEISELRIATPPDLTVTDVTAPGLAFWRFDPDARRLRISLEPAASRAFAVEIASQIVAGSLPYVREARLLRVEGAAGEVGMVGVATGAGTQLDDVTAEGPRPINLEDFPADFARPLATAEELAVRRAFRHTDSEGSLTIRASAVQPDIRVEWQETLSLGEDRTVLAAEMLAEIIRAGVFRLSFTLPPGLEVESVTGSSLSHWTELRDPNERVITLHLKGRTLGQQAFNVTLTGPGARSTNDWVAPRLDVREASKQRGRLLIVPEAGIRLQATRREGVTQTDPAESGVRQKGVLAFRLLQDDWTLAFNVEQIDAWIQVTGLQQVTFGEAQARVSATLRYEIENTGVRSFRLRLPTAADGVRFHGDNIADFSRGAADPATGLSEWEVKLERRVMGAALLRVTYSLPLPEPASEVVIAGIEALDANVQRGFVTLQTGGRLQAQADPPPALQATEWQTIPRFLQQDGAAIPTAHAFRMVEPAFRLPVRLNRHEAAPVLPARVSSVELTSVVSDNGDALTRARIRLAPGDKRLLAMTLPEGARFWFAFVNENSVWPWQATNQWLIPLERSARPQDESVVEFFYSSEAGQGGRASLNLNLEGPRLDLPLEDITWVVFLNDRWRIHEWDGTLTLRDEALTGASPGVDLSAYIQREAEARQQKSREAEEFLNLANSLLARGEPQQARRAFEAAYGMSQHDMAFNEDARVQLNNLKVQQALVGMNVRQARVAGAAEAIAAAPRDLLEDRGAYTQTQARELLGRKSAEESEAEARLAERLIQQQEAAVGSPAAIRASIPEQGRRVVFSKPVEVNPWSDLRVRIEARAEPEAGWTRKLGWLALLFIGAFAARASVRAR